MKRFFKKIGLSYKRARKTIMQNSKWKSYAEVVAQIKVVLGGVANKFCDLYYYDESGFSLNSNVPYRWSIIGVPTPIPANKFSKRINVLGFLNTSTKDLFAKTVEGKVNTDVVINFFNKFSKHIIKQTVVVLDNASIHRSKKFKEELKKWEKLGLHILYLPPYSPELNHIEMLWREMKYKWIDLNALGSFEEFHEHVKEMLNNFGTKYDINFS